MAGLLLDRPLANVAVPKRTQPRNAKHRNSFSFPYICKCPRNAPSPVRATAPTTLIHELKTVQQHPNQSFRSTAEQMCNALQEGDQVE